MATFSRKKLKVVKTQNSLTMERVSKFLDAQWQSSEAWHYFILALNNSSQQGKHVTIMQKHFFWLLIEKNIRDEAKICPIG